MMHPTLPAARPNICVTVPTAVGLTVQFALGSVILATSLTLYKIEQPKRTAGLPFADPDRQTAILTAGIKDVQPVLPVRRVDLIATVQQIQPVVPIRRISLPTCSAKEIQPVKPLRRIDLT